MIIELPKRFMYTGKNSRNYAYVKDRKLYIVGGVSYEDLMYSLTYSLYGYEECYYCGKKLNRKTITLDHMFPRSWGGVSITNNLKPCCQECNSSNKNRMTAIQYKKWLKIVDEKERKEYYKKAISINEERRQEGEIILPKKWMTQYEISNLRNKFDFSIIKDDKNYIDEFFSEHFAYPKPIIVSVNDWLLSGFHIIYHACKHKVYTAPAIVLENVIKM